MRLQLKPSFKWFGGDWQIRVPGVQLNYYKPLRGYESDEVLVGRYLVVFVAFRAGGFSIGPRNG